MLIVARMLEQVSALFLYAAFVLTFGGIAVAGSGMLTRKVIGPLALSADARQPSRVDIGLAAQDRATFHLPVRFDISMRAPSVLAVGVFAKQMDDAEAIIAAPRVAGWIGRVPPRSKLALEESPGNIVLRSLRAEL